MSIRRSVLGSRSTFRNTSKSLPGLNQIQGGTAAPPPVAPTYQANVDAMRAQRQSELQVYNSPSLNQSSTVLGHNTAAAYGPNSPGWDPLNDYVPSPSFDPNAWANATKPPGRTIADHWDPKTVPPAPIPPTVRTEAQEFPKGHTSRRVTDAIKNMGATIETADRSQIDAAISSVYNQFEIERRTFLNNREEAIRDGKADVAAQFDAQIRNLERDIAEFTRQLEVSNSVEEWFRNVIQEPYERAKQAALDVDYQPVLDMYDNSVGRVDEAYRSSVLRLDEALLEAGFTPDRLNAMRLAASQDNAVAASQMEVLRDTQVPKGLLEAQKQLMFHTADQLRLSQMRQSAGDQFVTAANKLRDIANSEDMIGELNVEKEAALGRVERAVQRAMGEGPLLPSRGQVTEAAMSTFLDSMLGEDHPWKGVYMEDAMAIIYADPNMKTFSLEDLGRLFESGALGDPQDRVTAEGIRQALAAKEITRAQATAAFANLASQSYDQDDLAILAGLVSTYHSAQQRAGIIADKAFKGSIQSNGGEAPGNRVYANRVAAEQLDTSNPYGQRRQTVLMYGDLWKDLGYRVDTGMRDWNAQVSNGRSSNSDHYTGGAMDIFYNAKDPKEMHDYETKLLPQLQQLAAQGIISFVVHPGQNAAHHDHVHISFNLPGAGHSNVNTTQWKAPSGAAPSPTPTASTGNASGTRVV